jgi:hypothetical protein
LSDKLPKESDLTDYIFDTIELNPEKSLMLWPLTLSRVAIPPGSNELALFLIPSKTLVI